jgi:pimeloyl-ACP methyl ester carboxylesterase
MIGPVVHSPEPRTHIRSFIRWTAALVGVLLLALVVTLVGFRVAASRREVYASHDAAPKTGRFVRAADVDLYVQEEGPPDGAPVLLVHGTGAWSEIWRETMHALAARGYRAIALDMPPFGFTSRPSNVDYGDDAQGRRILGVLDALHLERATLVGHSFGGRPTMQAAFLAPARVERLVLVDAALDLLRTQHSTADSTPQSPSVETGSPLLRAALGVDPFRDAVVASTLTNPRLTGWLLSRLIANQRAVTPERVTMLQRPFVVAGSTSRLGEWLVPFATTRTTSLATDRSRYRTICAPTLVLWGERDSITPLAQGEDLVRLVPNARWVVLRGAGHIPAIEDPPGFNAALTAFLDSASVRGPRACPVRD